MTLHLGRIEVAWELVTPAIADRWIKLANTSNRKIRRAQVGQYARDMAAGTWAQCLDAIMFDESGLLGNGQHRLMAIIESGIAQYMLVARNVPKATIARADRGLTRSLNDVAKFLESSLESRPASVARIVEYGLSDRLSAVSFDELLDAYLKHQEPIDWACSTMPKSAGFSAPVLAVLVRATYTQDRNKLNRFAEILRTGVADSHESAAIRLRDSIRAMPRAGGTAIRAAIYQRTEAALSYFLRGEPMSRLYGTAKELFPITTTEPLKEAA